MITTITRKMEWDMGHRLQSHQSKCRNLHGHRYLVEITLAGLIVEVRGDPEKGMVADFSRAKAILSDVLDYWDHGCMIEITDPWLSTLRDLDTKIIEVAFSPTAENIASELFRFATEALKESQIEVVEITVWETPNCKATVKG